MLGNLGEGSDCLWQGLVLPKVAGIIVYELIPSSVLTVRSSVALCLVISLI